MAKKKKLQNSSTYWEGNNQAETLQRIYGISFPDSKQLKEWKHFQEEAAKRDHRKLGRVSESSFIAKSVYLDVESITEYVLFWPLSISPSSVLYDSLSLSLSPSIPGSGAILLS